MNVLDAIYNAAHKYPGGVEALAVRMERSPQLLRNKLNTNSTSNVLSLQEFDQALHYVDHSPLHALAANHGYALFKLEAGQPCDVEVLEMVVGLVASHGRVGAEIYKALADGRIEPNEVTAIKAAAFDVHRDLQTLVARIAAMVEK